MTEYHPNMDLIIALADGELPPEEAARIEAQLDTEALAELAAQRELTAALGELRRRTLTSDERRRLHTRIRRELRLHRGGGQANGSGHVRRPWFGRPQPALAVAAALVAVIAVAVNLIDRPMAEEPARTAEAPMTVTTRTAVADGAPVSTSAPARTTTTVAATVTTTATTAEAVAEEQVVEEPTEILASARAATEQAAAVLDEAEATTTTETTEAQTTGDAREVPESLAHLGRTIEPLTLNVPLIFLADRPEDFLEFTDAHIADYPDQAFPVAQLPDRAAAQGLECWEYVVEVANSGDSVSFMGVGYIDRYEGEGYRIERGPPRSDDPTDQDASLIFLFTHPDCHQVYFHFQPG